MKKLLILSLFTILNACAYHSTMGENNRFKVDEYTSLLAPSITLVTDTKTGNVLPFGGQSAVSQLAGPASTVAGAALLAEGFSNSGDTTVNANQNDASANARANATAKAKSSSNSSSTSNPTINNRPTVVIPSPRRPVPRGNY